MVSLDDGYLRIANELWDQILRRDFSKNQLAILNLIIRLSYGTAKRTCIIPRKKDFEVTGIDETIVERVLKELERAKVIERSGGKLYNLNKNHSEWAISYKRSRTVIEPDQRLKELIHMNIEEPDPGRVKQGGLFGPEKGKKGKGGKSKATGRKKAKDAQNGRITGDVIGFHNLPKDHPAWDVVQFLEDTLLDTGLHHNPRYDIEIITACNVMGVENTMRFARNVINRYKADHSSVPGAAYVIKALTNQAAAFKDVKADFEESDIKEDDLG